MATGDKRIDFYLKKFLSVDQVEANFFGYLKNYLAAYLAQKEPGSGIWSPDPFTFAGGSGAGLFTVAPSEDVILMDNAGNVLELAQATGVDIPFENANLVDYYVGAKFIEIPDDPETNPRYNTPKWKLTRDAVGELDDPDSISDQGGGVFRFVINSITESGVDHSGRTCRVYLKTPTDLGDNYLETTVQYSGGNNYVDLSTGGALGDISTDETLYSAVIEGYTWRRNTDLSTLPEYAFLGTVQGKTAAPPDTFNYTGQYKLSRTWTDTDFLNLKTAFELEHDYDPGSGDHSDITADSIASKAAAPLGISADLALGLNADTDILVDIDHNDNENDREFKVTHDTAGEDLLIVEEATKRTRAKHYGFIDETDRNLFFRIFPLQPSDIDDPLKSQLITSSSGDIFPAPVYTKYRSPKEIILMHEDGASVGNIKCIYFDPATASWLSRANPFTINSPVAGDNWSQCHAIQLVNGDIACVAYNSRAGEVNVWFSKSPDAGATWSTPVRVVAASGIIDRYPTITQLTNGDLLVCYTHGGAPQQSIYGAVSGDGGATWGTPFAIHQSATYISGQGFILQLPGGGDVVCAFATSEPSVGSSFDTVIKRSADGITWTVGSYDSIIEQSTSPEEEFPALFYNEPTGEMYCVYDKDVGGQKRIFLEVSLDGGVSWQIGLGNSHEIDNSGQGDNIVSRFSYWPDFLFGIFANNISSPGVTFFKLIQTVHIAARS